MLRQCPDSNEGTASVRPTGCRRSAGRARFAVFGVKTDFMYTASSTLRRPNSSLQPLWRYLSADRLHDLLRTEELYFAHLSVLEDRHEGALTRRSFEHMANWFQNQNRSTRAAAYEEAEKYQSYRGTFSVNCWHMNRHESYLMWKAYASRGYAIRTTFERVQAALDATPAAITGGEVEYVDFERDFTPVGNIFNHVATKDLPYTDECEFRLVFWSTNPSNADYPRTDRGVRIRVDPKMLIGSVVRSPYNDPLGPGTEQLLMKYGIPLEASAVKIGRPK